MSKNAITIEQLKILCRHVKELRDAGMTENLAIRLLELSANVYAKFRRVGRASPDHADEYKLWSKAALKAKRANPRMPYGAYLRVEHGTPRRQFARLVLEGFDHGNLTEAWLNKLCDKRWKVAVITHEEDRRLPRSQLFETPEERWKAAGIKF
jgi:hypothetical protein